MTDSSPPVDEVTMNENSTKKFRDWRVFVKSSFGRKPS
jgi:hypothetical protein